VMQSKKQAVFKILLERRGGRGVILKPYKRPNKKENGPKSFSRDWLWTLGKGW